MFPNFCGAMGLAGWLVMLLIWAGLVSLVVWGIAGLFPGHPRPADPTVASPQRGEDAPESLVESGRR